MKNSLLIIGFACALISSSAEDTSDSLKVSLYYEALCPGCVEFIVGQLNPGYQKLGSSLIVELVPYGNANREQVDGHWKIDCQHGPRECRLNKLEACGLAKATSQNEQMEFVNCVEMAIHDHDNEDVVNASECGKKIGLEPTVLLQCASGEEGDELLLRQAEKTEALNPPHEYTPWIVFNGKYDAKIAEQGRENFLKTACSLLDNKPRVCPNPDDEYNLL